ncbi:hypothetical protein VTI74DRAFT_1146 [Chaetomium olivicolor]
MVLHRRARSLLGDNCYINQAFLCDEPSFSPVLTWPRAPPRPALLGRPVSPRTSKESKRRCVPYPVVRPEAGDWGSHNIVLGPGFKSARATATSASIPARSSTERFNESNAPLVPTQPTASPTTTPSSPSSSSQGQQTQ